MQNVEEVSASLAASDSIFWNRLLLSHCKAAMREMIADSGAIDSIPPNNIFISNHDAVLYCLSGSQSGERVPLLSPSSDEEENPVGSSSTNDLPEVTDDPEEIVSVVDETDIYVVDVGKLSNGETKGFLPNDGEITKL